MSVLYRKTVNLLRYVSSVHYQIPDHDAEEIVNDAYLAYLTQKATIRDPKAWLTGTVRNASKQYWRRRGREVPLPPEAEELPDIRDEERRRAFIDRLVAEKVMKRLSARDRDLLEMYYLGGQNTSAIAAAIGTTAGTVQVFLHQSRRRAQLLYQDLMRVKR
jgi:RNA polymerase sigma factor (sigma-70 family)